MKTKTKTRNGLSAATRKRLAVIRGSQSLDPTKGFSHHCDVTGKSSSDGYIILTYRISDGKPRDVYPLATCFVSDKAAARGDLNYALDDSIVGQIADAIDEDYQTEADVDDMDEDDEEDEDE